MHILEEWRIRDIEQKAEQANRRLYELDKIRSEMGRLEHTCRENSSEIARLRDELQRSKETIEYLVNQPSNYGNMV